MLTDARGHFDYFPTPTLRRFHQSDSEFRVVVGPYGSGKTFAMIMECLRRACEQEPDARGVRNTRCAIVRQTRPQIITTILPEIQQAIGPITHFKPTGGGGGGAVYLYFELGDGTRVSSEWLFMPLQEETDQRRLLSLNLTWIWISELRELSYALVEAVRGRAGRFPAQHPVPPTWYGLFGETNPWRVSSRWHENFVEQKPDEWELYRQPGGLDADAENLRNLPGGVDYYHGLMRGASREWIDVHVHALWGHDREGVPVYATTYEPSFHASPEPLSPNPRLPLLVGQDFGRTPAALIAQVTPDTRLKIFAEVTGENMGLEYFIDTELLPILNSKRFSGFEHTVVADPAGAHKDQRGEESLFDCLERKGFAIQPVITDRLDPRIRAVEAAFVQHRGSYPAIHVDKENCPLLCQALEYGYKYGRKKDGQMNETPVKNHPWSDLADALGYLALAVFGAQTDFLTSRKPKTSELVKKFLSKPRPTTGGWT